MFFKITTEEPVKKASGFSLMCNEVFDFHNSWIIKSISVCAGLCVGWVGGGIIRKNRILIL